MDGSGPDEKRNSLDKTGRPSASNINTPNSDPSVHSLTNGQDTSKPNNNAAFVDDVDTEDKSTLPARPTNYGYLEHIQSLKPLLVLEGKTLPKKVKAHYLVQLELITSIEDILLPKSDEQIDHETAYQKKHIRTMKIVTMITLAVNIFLVVIKIVGAVLSKSLSIISTLIDSAVDLVMSLLLIWTARKIENRDIYKYPGGRTRLEPIAIVILAEIMCAASVLIIFESIETLDSDIEYFKHEDDPSSTYTLPDIDMSVIPIVTMVLTIVSKAILFIFSYRIKNPVMYALAVDSLNDVASNAVALVCGLIGSWAVQGKINEKAAVVDPLGALLISVYIIIVWIVQANEQVRRLTGVSAEPYFLQQLTHIVYNYRPDVIKKIFLVQALYHGTEFFVEVHIALPSSMPLSEAHDIGINLQNQLETIADIERAFVRLDYVSEDMADGEHKDMHVIVESSIN